MIKEKRLRDRELNPGLPRDRRGYLPLYYRGFVRTPSLVCTFKPTFWKAKHRNGKNLTADLGLYVRYENLKFNDLYSYSSLRLDLKQLEAGVFVLLTLVLGVEDEYLVPGHAHPLFFGRF